MRNLLKNSGASIVGTPLLLLPPVSLVLLFSPGYFSFEVTNESLAGVSLILVLKRVEGKILSILRKLTLKFMSLMIEVK